MQNKNDMWIEFLIIKIIRFFLCTQTGCLMYETSVCQCCVTENMVSGKFFMQTFISKAKHQGNFSCCLYILCRYTHTKKYSCFYIVQCRFSVFVCGVRVLLAVKQLLSCYTLIFIFSRESLLFSLLVRCKSNRDRVKNWYSFCFSCSVFDKNINCRKVLWKIYEIKNFVWMYWWYSLVLRIDVVLRWSDCF